MLTAGTSGFAAGMSKAGSSLASFGGQVASQATKVTAWAGGLASIATGGGLALLVSKQLEAIDANAKLSDRLNVSTEALAAMQLAGDLAGVSSEMLSGSLTKMQKAISGAAEDGSATGEAFKALGLDTAALMNLPVDKQFGMIADALGKQTNATTRAALEMKIFGKTGATMDAMIRGGSASLEIAAEKTAAWGLAISRVDAAQVEAANDSMTEVGKTIEGVGAQLAVKFSPFIEAAAIQLTAFATDGRGSASLVTDGFEMVVSGVASATDYVSLLEGGFHGFRAGALEAISGTLEGIDSLGDGLVNFLNLLPGVDVAWTDTFSTLKAGFAEVATEEAAKFQESMDNFASGKNSLATSKFFDELRAKSEANAQKIAADAKASNAGPYWEDDGEILEQVTEQAEKIAKVKEHAEKAVAVKSDAPDIAPDTPSILMAGSAAAQRFAFEQSRGGDALGRDETQKEQLGELEEANEKLERMTRGIETMANNSNDATVINEF